MPVVERLQHTLACRAIRADLAAQLGKPNLNIWVAGDGDGYALIGGRPWGPLHVVELVSTGGQEASILRAILDWTGRQVRSDKRGAIPRDLLPILKRLGMRTESWIDCVENFGRWFHRAAGRVTHLSGEAARAGRPWFHGVSRCRQAFASTASAPDGPP